MITLHATAACASLYPLLQATSWQGEIAAIFHRSLLCTPSAERLLHLHTGAQLVSPFSLRLEGDFARVLRVPSLVRGVPVRKIGAAIYIAEHIQLTLDEVRYYQSPTHRTAVVNADAVKLAWQLLRSNGRGDGFEQLPGAQTIITAMQQAIIDSNSAERLGAMRRLIGWGPGLTPSGDDVLVGCLRGLWLINWNQPARSERLDCWRNALLPELNARTTRVGAEFIRYALDGAFAEVLDQAALSLLDAFHPLVVQSAVNRLLAQGETSGTDTVLGLLRCLEALLRVFDPEP